MSTSRRFRLGSADRNGVAAARAGRGVASEVGLLLEWMLVPEVPAVGGTVDVLLGELGGRARTPEEQGSVDRPQVGQDGSRRG